MKTERQQEIGDYYVGRTLGSGTTGKVKLATKKGTNHQVAIKIIKKSSFDSKPDFQRKIRREVALMRLVDHPHLLKLEEFAESPRHLYIILEYGTNGELFDYLVKRHNLSVEQAMSFFREMVFGIEYLHNHGICHRDLKPENILLDKYDHIKIADFGFARWMRSNIADTSCGSPHYAAPEVIKGIQYDGRSSDIWSLGVILFALLAGRLPFDDPSIRNLLSKVKAGRYRMPDFPEPVQDLISKILTVDPALRITMDGIKEHIAFRLYTPEAYVFPKPLPIPFLTEPVDPDSVLPATFSVLKCIGYNSDQEIIDELQSPTHTTAKVFAMMLARSVSPSAFVWPSGEVMVAPVDSFIVSPQPEALGVFQSSDPFRRRRFEAMGPQSATPEVYSLKEGNMFGWDDVAPPAAEIEPVAMENIFLKLDTLMAGLQGALTSSGFEWLHPDDFTLFARKLGADSCMVIAAERTSEEELGLTIAPVVPDAAILAELSDIVQRAIEELLGTVEEAPQEDAEQVEIVL